MHQHIAQIYLAKGEIGASLKHAQIALEHHQMQHSKTGLVEIHHLLSTAYKKLQKFDLALYHHECYTTVKDEVLNEESQRKTRALEVIHRMEMLEKESGILKEKNKELEHYITELQELHAQVKELSIRDALSGLYNRRYLMEQADNILRIAQRYQHHFSLAMIDIDYFKSINDRFLHETGDNVIKKVAQILQGSLRDADLVARYGGEEFAIVLPETPLESATLACERLRKTIEHYPWSTIHPELNVTVSVGVTTKTGVENLDELFNLADQQLYKAKHAGRNQVAYVR